MPGGEKGLECEIRVDGTRFQEVSELKYLGCVLDKSNTDAVEYCRELSNGRKVADAIKFHG